ncbi:MAG: HEAT repeat domain-containing protein [Vicinamibacterales bacterium]
MLKSISFLVIALTGCTSVPTVVAPVAPSVDEQISWILRLEDQRKLADPIPESVVPDNELALDGSLLEPPEPLLRPDLVLLATEGSPSVRRRAALALGRIGVIDGVEALSLLLNDSEPEVRQMAAFGLGLIGDAAATEVLLSALNDTSPIVQGRAAQALAQIGASEAAPAIGEMVKSYVTSAFEVDPEDVSYPHVDEVEAFRLGIYALGELKAFEPLAEAVIGDGGQPILWWWPVAYALGRTEDPRALPALATLTGVQGSVGVSISAHALGVLNDIRAISPLTDLLDFDRRDRPVIVSAIQALGKMTLPEAATVLDKFVRVRSLDRRLRLEVVEALSRHRSIASIEVFMELLAHPWAPLRAASLRALAHTDPESFMFVLSGLGPDPDWRVRSALAEGLRWVRPEAARYRLTVMLNDEDQRVIPQVLKSLVAVDETASTKILKEYLRSSDIGVRKTAANLLGKFLNSDSEKVLIELFDNIESDSSYVVRTALMDALANYGIEAAHDILVEGLKDEEWAVRVRATEHLERLLPEDSFEGPGSAQGLRRVDYRAAGLINPQVSPHAYIETDYGTIEIELAVIDAPLTSENFITLASQGYYDGLAFYEVFSNEAVYTGDPRGDGNGGPGYTLRDEQNQLPFLRGAVGMARDWRDSAGSRFFITHSPQPYLDSRYTVFGNVVDGMDVLNRLEPGDRIDRLYVWDGVNLLGGNEPEP